MASAVDLYQVLGVARDATGDDIRKAYRRLARELHPDVNSDPEAGERFKQVTAAYEVLSDPAKRRRYDTMGSGSLEDLFPFGDIFEAFFGGGFGRRQRTRPTRVRRGGDVFATLSLSFDEAVFGTQREVPIESLEACTRCNGTGSEPGTGTKRCSRCGGSGEVQDVQRSIFGTIMTARPCDACEGTGEEIVERCTDCGGDGRVTRRQTVTVEVPAGVSDGMELQVSSAGDSGRQGGPAGDLYLNISVKPHPFLDRRGNDLHSILDVPMTQAALGTELEVETLDGVERVKLYPGTQSGEVIRLRGRGVPHLGRRGRGDLYLTVHVRTPEGLRREERQLVSRLAEMRGDAPGRGSTPMARLRRPDR